MTILSSFQDCHFHLFFTVPAWLKLCNDNLCEFLYALDVGNSGDGKTAREVLTVIFKSSSYKDLVDNLQNSYLDPATKLVPKAKLSPETAVYWSNLAKYLHDESETQVHKLLNKLHKLQFSTDNN